MIVPLFDDASEIYINKINRKTYLVYWILLVIIIVALASLPFIYFDITIKSRGIIRPSSERTEVTALISGVIDSIYYCEGQIVFKNNTIARLRNNTTNSKLYLNEYQLLEHKNYIDDLTMLTDYKHIVPATIDKLKSLVYKRQLISFLNQKEEKDAHLKKVKNELKINEVLSLHNAISSQELFNKKTEHSQLQSSCKYFISTQISVWQQELSKYQLELSQIELEKKRIEEEQQFCEIRAPISGTIQGIVAKYSGCNLQAGETICNISPETDLMAECYIQPSDIGLIQLNQEVKFQIDAFDYNYFGFMSGKVKNIDNDYNLIQNNPVFIVRCSIDSIQLRLKNGFTGKMKKGLTLQALFVVTKRSLGQLLFDKIDDWLNPNAPQKQ